MRVRVYSLSKTLEPVFIVDLEEGEVRNNLHLLLERYGAVILEAEKSSEEPSASVPGLRNHILCALKELFPLVYWLALKVRGRSEREG